MLTKEELDQINRFSKAELTADQVYTFSVMGRKRNRKMMVLKTKGSASFFTSFAGNNGFSIPGAGGLD